jgi:hypothetical protein
MIPLEDRLREIIKTLAYTCYCDERTPSKMEELVKEANEIINIFEIES